MFSLVAQKHQLNHTTSRFVAFSTEYGRDMDEHDRVGVDPTHRPVCGDAVLAPLLITSCAGDDTAGRGE